MPSIRAERLSFAYGDAVPVLSDVTVHLRVGFTGVVGENGAGKSTFLRLVAGELVPDAGSLRVEPEGALVVHCPQGVEVATPDVHAFAREADGGGGRLASMLGLDPPQLERWQTLSPGERRRWQIGAALAREPDVLLLDEPTNHVDAAARALLVGALRRFRGVGLVVSHDRELLEAISSATLRIHRTGGRVYAGRYGVAREAWEAERAAAWSARAEAQEAARRAAQQLDEARQELARGGARRRAGARAKGLRDHDARSMGAKVVAGWAEDRQGRKVAVLRREAERARGDVPAVSPERELGRSVVVGFERAPRPTVLALQADEVVAGRVGVLRDVSVRLGREDRVHLQGPNGSGKTTLLRELLASAAGIPPERLLHLPQELSTEERGAVLERARALPADVRGRVLSVVAALGVDPDRLLASRSPSPGEARKLLLALGLGGHAWALALDEPTNHLDLPSVERLEAALASYPGAILLVTHDRAFAAACTSSVWRISDGRVTCA